LPKRLLLREGGRRKGEKLTTKAIVGGAEGAIAPLNCRKLAGKIKKLFSLQAKITMTRSLSCFYLFLRLPH
jgi:hypothetical protein